MTIVIESPDRLVVQAVLSGAAARMRAAGVTPQLVGCECDHRADSDLPSSEPYPGPEGAGRPWCMLCAVESQQIALNVHGDYYGHALAAIAKHLSGRTYSLLEFVERDDVLLPWSEGASADAIIETFDAVASEQLA